MAESTPLIDEVSLEEQNNMADHASNTEVRDPWRRAATGPSDEVGLLRSVI